jgi:hypothetical protein
MRVALWLLWIAAGIMSVPWGALSPEAGRTACKQGLCRCEYCAHHDMCCQHQQDGTQLQSGCTCNRSLTLYVSPLPPAVMPKPITAACPALDAMRLFWLSEQLPNFSLCPSPPPPRLA